MRRKILFISSWYPNRLEPTNGNFVQRHAEAVAIYHDVEVLHAIGDFNLNSPFEIVDEHMNAVRTVTVYYKNSRNRMKNFLNRMRAYHLGFKKIHFPDLVHANVLRNNLLFAFYLKKKFKIPFVVSEHWSGFLPERSATLSPLTLKAARFIAGHAEAVLPVSENLLKNLKHLGIGRQHIQVPNVVDTEIFRPSSEKKPAVFTFLHISNLVSLKRPLEIIHAAVALKARNGHFKLNIGGDGDTSALEEAVKIAGAESYIHVFGALEHAEVASKMQQAHCFVLFSEYENQPCVLLESLACGVPVITTNVGGVPEFITKERGLLINGRTEELVDAMEKILKNERTFAPAYKLHRSINSEYAPEAVGKRLTAIYNSVLRHGNT